VSSTEIQCDGESASFTLGGEIAAVADALALVVHSLTIKPPLGWRGYGPELRA
jgi:hypothetical protein